jgi:hypothetical protein
MNNPELQTIKNVVEEVLTQDLKTRDSDKWLILQVIRKLGFRIYVDYEELRRMPSFESITRARRYIQNTEKKLLPSFPVGEVRNLNENNYKEFFRS